MAVHALLESFHNIWYNYNSIFILLSVKILRLVQGTTMFWDYKHQKLVYNFASHTFRKSQQNIVQSIQLVRM